MRTVGCPFCDLTKKDNVFAEGPNFVAAYNIAPVVPGHSLVVTRRHVASLLDFNKDELADLSFFALATTKLVLAYFDYTGFDWSVQDSEEAGQTILHFHLHIIPRRPNDLPESVDWTDLLHNAERIDSSERPDLDPHQLDQIVQGLRDFALENGAQPGVAAPQIGL
jgi:bis(5'-adenosyl)-triphosphatase